MVFNSQCNYTVWFLTITNRIGSFILHWIILNMFWTEHNCLLIDIEENGDNWINMHTKKKKGFSVVGFKNQKSKIVYL